MSNYRYSTGRNVRGKGTKEPGGEQARKQTSQGANQAETGAKEPGGEPAKGRKSQTPMARSKPIVSDLLYCMTVCTADCRSSRRMVTAIYELQGGQKTGPLCYIASSFRNTA